MYGVLLSQIHMHSVFLETRLVICTSLVSQDKFFHDSVNFGLLPWNAIHSYIDAISKLIAVIHIKLYTFLNSLLKISTN